MPLVDLDDPADLRARWSALAAVAHATGYDRRWWADEIGWHHEDAAGNDLRMAVLDDDRAVLFGFHIECSQTAVQASGTDLLGGAPEWIAQPEVRHRIATGELGFVYGQFSGTWARAGYPGDPWQPIDDGFLAVGGWLTSDEETAAELAEWAAEWADFLGSTDHLMPAALELVQAAGSTGISSDHLLDLFDLLGIGPGSPRHPDLAAALHAGAAFGGPTPAPQPVAPQPADDWSGQDAFARLGLVDDPYYPEPQYDSPFQQPAYDDPYQPAGYEYVDQPTPDPYPGPYAGPRIEDYNDLFADPTPTPVQPPDPVADRPPFAHPTHQPPADRSGDPVPDRSPFAHPTDQPPAGRSSGQAAEDSPFAHPAQQASAGPSGDGIADRTTRADGTSQAPPSRQQPPAGQPGDQSADESPFAHPAQQPSAARSGDEIADRSPFVQPAQRPTAGDEVADGSPVVERAIRADHRSPQAPPSQQQPTPEQPGDQSADESPFVPPQQQAAAGRSGVQAGEDSPFAPPAQQPTSGRSGGRAGEDSPFAPSEQQAAAGRSGDGVVGESPAADRGKRFDRSSPDGPATQQRPAAGPSGEQATEGSQFAQQPSAREVGDQAASASPFAPPGQQAAGGRSGEQVAGDGPLSGRPRRAVAGSDQRGGEPRQSDDERRQFDERSPDVASSQPPTAAPTGAPAGQSPTAVPAGQSPTAGQASDAVAAGEQGAAGGRAGRDSGEGAPGQHRTVEPAAAQSAAESYEQRPVAGQDVQQPAARRSEEQGAGGGREQGAGREGVGGRSEAVGSGSSAGVPAGRVDGGVGESLPGAMLPPGVVGGAAVAGKANGKAGKGRGSRRRDRGPDGVPEQRQEPAQASKLVFPSFVPPVVEEPPAAPAGSLEAAIRAETERSRPRHKRTEAEELLHEWCLARTRVVPSGFTIEVQALDPSALVFAFDLQPPPVPGFERVGGLLNDLWQAEAHAERGGWLFARIDAAGRTLRIDRWYDQVPFWWEHDLDDAVDVPGLLRRLSDRGPQWRPSYLNRLPADAR